MCALIAEASSGRHFHVAEGAEAATREPASTRRGVFAGDQNRSLVVKSLRGARDALLGEHGGVREAGAGSPVGFLHGNPMSSHVWPATSKRGSRPSRCANWTDESFFLFPPESRIVVLDVATDTVVREIVAPCPGLDYATMDADSNIFFSAWVYAPGGAAVLAQASTCVFEVPSEGEPEVAFEVASLTEGREGGVLRHVGNGRALMYELDDSQTSTALFDTEGWGTRLFRSR